MRRSRAAQQQLVLSLRDLPAELWCLISCSAQQRNNFVEWNLIEGPGFNSRPSRGGDYERPYLSHWPNRRDYVYSFVPRASLMEKSGMAEQIVPSDLEGRGITEKRVSRL